MRVREKPPSYILNFEFVLLSHREIDRKKERERERERQRDRETETEKKNKL